MGPGASDKGTVMYKRIYTNNLINLRLALWGLALLVILAAMTILTAGRVAADTPPVVSAPGGTTVVAEGPEGTPATNPKIAAFLSGATVSHHPPADRPVP